MLHENDRIPGSNGDIGYKLGRVCTQGMKGGRQSREAAAIRARLTVGGDFEASSAPARAPLGSALASADRDDRIPQILPETPKPKVGLARCVPSRS
jgi:hypothetical protein